MTRSGGALRAFLADSLHLIALCGLAIAQPLYDLAGHNAEFLVAHRADRRAIVALVLVLSAAVPAALIARVLLLPPDGGADARRAGARAISSGCAAGRSRRRQGRSAWPGGSSARI